MLAAVSTQSVVNTDVKVDCTARNLHARNASAHVQCGLEQHAGLVSDCSTIKQTDQSLTTSMYAGCGARRTIKMCRLCCKYLFTTLLINILMNDYVNNLKGWNFSLL